MAGMAAADAAHAPPRFGEVKGPLVVWLVVAAYFALAISLTASPGPLWKQPLSPSLVVQLVLSIVVGWGPILGFLVVFVMRRERRPSLRATFASLGFKAEGLGRSILWSLLLLPAFAAVYLGSSVAVALVGSGSASQVLSPGGGVPQWYLAYMVAYSFFPVAVVEEALGRGYVLDRLVPHHPIRVIEAMPAILLSAFLFTAYHLPAYLLRYPLSPAAALVLLATNVFPFSVLMGIAYLRAKARNVAGPVFVHFLLDGGLYLALLLTV